MSKYGNRKVTVDGINFDSLAERRRYCELRLLERAGEISDLHVHHRFDLNVTDKSGLLTCVGYYEADFAYRSKALGVFDFIIEDVKGVRTPVYRLKKKLVKAIYGIDITEVEA